MKKRFLLVVSICIGLLFSACSIRNDYPLTSRTVKISDGWHMQTSQKTDDSKDSQISTADYNPEGWMEAIVPGTVLGSMALKGVIKEPYRGVNMLDVDEEQFSHPWWYRTTFEIEEEDLNKNISLRFNGINYRADLWVNGKKVAGNDEFAGSFRMFSFDITELVQSGENILALKMWQHVDGEYSIGFFDWNPAPRDKNMGIWRDVVLEVTESVKIRSPFVYSKVDKKSLKDADLYIQTVLSNQSDQSVKGLVVVDYELGRLEKKVSLSPGETINCKFSPEEYAQLKVNNVDLWWPNGMGEANLYNLKVEFVADGKTIDRVEKRYGIREIDTYLDENKNRAFEVNGEFVLLRGGGWVDDLLLQDTEQSLEAQLKYIHHMNLNSIRCEGFWGKDETLYDLCDEYGILVMVGWSCHWEWESALKKPTHPKYGGPVSDEDINLMEAYWKDQMIWLRNHPCIYIWMLGSDLIPHPKLEQKYVDLFNEYDPSRSYSTSAGGVGTENDTIIVDVALVSDISGPTGMKMLGPYAVTPPEYWFTDTKRGGAYGFNTETCPGPNIPPFSTLRKMFAVDDLWPISKEVWEYHTGREPFKTLDRYREFLNERYGESGNVEEFAFKSQVNNYELMRPMFEAFIAHKPVSTGLVQWMLNSAWPALIWQLYDTYLQPNGSFYAVRNACNPLHAIYRYGFDDIYIANEDLHDANNIRVDMKAYDLNAKVLFEDSWNGNVQTNRSKFIYKLPEIKGLTDVWFLTLSVYDQQGKEVDHSFYWMPLKKDILDYEASKLLDWAYYTPTSQYADYTALDQLPTIKMDYSYEFEKGAKQGKITLKVKNPSESLAFFTYFDIVKPGTEDPILPVYWSDNYISLLPGEERTYTASYFLENYNGTKPEIKVKAWNVDPVRLK